MRRLPLSLVFVSLACAPGEPSSQASPSPTPEAVAPAKPEPAKPEPPSSVSGCEPTAIAAARTTLATASAQGVAPEYLADCRPEQVVCEAERRPLPATDACQIFAYHSDARWEIVVIPRPASGAPTRLEIWVDEAGEASGRVQISGSTWGVLEGVWIEGRGEYAYHEHGGEPAHIGGARFVVSNQRDEPLELKLVATRWLVAYSCELPRQEQARPKPAGLARGDDLIDGDTSVTIPPGATESVRVGHEVLPAYMVHCDRFATAASFEIDGKQLEVIAEHHVVREEPLRPP